MSCKLKKNTWGPKSPLFLLYFKKLCDDYQNLNLVFFVIYLASWGYIG